MKYYDETKPLYTAMDASGAGLGDTLVQTRNNAICAKGEDPDNSILRPIAFTSKSLTRGILYGLDKLQNYCFVREVSIIMDHKQLITIFKRHCNIITDTAVNSTKNTSIQSENHI